jgi:hypothetical protein
LKHKTAPAEARLKPKAVILPMLAGKTDEPLSPVIWSKDGREWVETRLMNGRWI